MADQQRVWADYTTVGHATTFTVVLSERQRAGLEVGDTVVVEGDDVPDQLAMVTAVDGRLVTVALATSVTVDFGLTDERTGRTYGLLDDVQPAAHVPAVGDVLTDVGEDGTTRPATVVLVDDTSLRLRVDGN